MVLVSAELPVILADVFSVYLRSIQAADGRVHRLGHDRFNPSFISQLKMDTLLVINTVSAVNETSALFSFQNYNH